MKLNLEHLASLIVLAESGSFAKAAKRLSKVRSALSYDIRSLEGHLGVALLDRSGYRASLTDIGKIVVERGQHLLRGAESLEHLAKQFGEAWEPTLKLVIEGAIPLGPVMRVIQKLNEQHVPTIFDLQTEFLTGVPKRFEHEQADLMLVKDFDAPRDKYEVCELPSVHCFLVAAATHPVFEGMPSGVTLEELWQHVELNIEVPGAHSSQMSDRRMGSPRVFNLSGFHSKKEALLLGLGFGWMPGEFIRDELDDGRLKMIPFEDGTSFQFTPSLMYRKGRVLGRTAELFVSMLIDEFHKIEPSKMAIDLLR